MRTARRWGLALVAMLWPGLLLAQTRDNQATIRVPEVEVRSGPSLHYYPTSRLHQGDVVKIVREENGWLAIEPPAGSFSWINAQAVDRLSQHSRDVVVLAPDTPVRVGSELVDAPPTVEWPQARQSRGTILTTIGRARTSRDGWWLPIQPAPREVRYLPADAIKPRETVAGAPALPATPAATSFGSTALQTSSGKSPEFSNLWQRAEQAERAGRTDEAIRLYEQLARETQDHALALRGLNRSQFLRDSAPAANSVSASPVSRPTDLALPTSQGENRLTPTAATAPASSANFASAPGLGESSTAVRLAAPVPPPSRPAAVPQATWYGPGRLRKVWFAVAGKQAYSLELPNYNRPLYVTASYGVNLEPFEMRQIYLYGAVNYHNELRNYHLQAIQVSPAQ